MRDLAVKVDGTSTLSASDFNANFGSELENFITATDQTLDAAGGPDTGGLEMMGKAAAAYANAGAVYQDSGTANAYILAIASNLKSVTKYYDGLRASFKVGNTNTGASTVNIAAIGAKSITLPDGSALGASALVEDVYANLIYNLSDDRFELVQFGVEKAIDFESLDLIINVQSNTTVDANAKRISMLNSSFIPAFIDDLDITLDIISDLMPGTFEKVSTWYQMWVDSIGGKKLVPDLTGITDSTSAGKLADSTATFQTDLVKAGDIVFNLTDLTQTTVSADASAEGEISLTDDIFTSGEDYKIRMLSPVGLGTFKARIGAAYNNSGSNFDDSTYAKIQEERTYSEAAGNFTLSGPAGWSTSGSAIVVKQVNDWTGQGFWRVIINLQGTLTASTSFAITFSGLIFKTGYTQIVARGVGSSTITDNAFISTGGSVVTFLTSATVTQALVYVDAELDKKSTFHN